MTRGAKQVLVGSAAGLVLVVLVALVLVDSDSNEIASGLIYSTEAGDPIDLVYGPDESGLGCMRVEAFTYGGNVSCPDPQNVEDEGSYLVAIPELAEMPAVVVGIMPAGATGATVGGVGRKTTRAETRGRWFLASLEPADPSLLDLTPVRVEFDGS